MDFERDVIVQNLELQLSELEMLSSMFPNEGEFQITDPGVVSDMQDFIAGNIDLSEVPKLEYLLTQHIGGEKVVISISLPHGYPDQNPQASVQCASLSRNNHESLNSELKHYLSLSENGALCVGTLIEWVKENFENFLSASTQSEQVHCTSTNSSETKSLRLWIQSHHIYSKTKMDNIQDWAKQLCLRGFILPGKPGFLCVEGGEKNCQQWWQQVRGMNWQKITCRLEERDSEKKFLIFENIAAIRNSEQSGMKAFLKYLEEHASSHVFKEFFGFDGK